jgi:hypothetical protein
VPYVNEGVGRHGATRRLRAWPANSAPTRHWHLQAADCPGIDNMNLAARCIRSPAELPGLDGLHLREERG